MEMIRYDNPEWVWCFLVIPVFVLVFLWARYRRRKNLQRFGRKNVLTRMAPLASGTRPWIKFILLMLAFSLAVVAAINPQTGSRLEEARREGVDIIVALDVSRSMLAQDVRPGRLDRAKLAVNRLIDGLQQDRFGLVVFAGTAHTQIPLTADFQAAKMLLQSVGTESVSIQGTAIGKAIERAIASFPESDLQNKTIILISDGENHEDNPLEYAQLARDQGIRIHTVGIGSREGAPIPVFENGNLTGFLRDHEGNTVITRYDEQMMRQLASITGGVFRHGRGADMGLDSILEQIRALETEQYETSIFAEYESRFHYFAALALLCLILDFLIRDRKNRWFGKIKLFDSWL